MVHITVCWYTLGQRLYGDFLVNIPSVPWMVWDGQRTPETKRHGCFCSIQEVWDIVAKKDGWWSRGVTPCTPKNQTPGLPTGHFKEILGWKSFGLEFRCEKKTLQEKKGTSRKKTRTHTKHNFEPNLTPKSRFVESYFSHFSKSDFFHKFAEESSVHGRCTCWHPLRPVKGSQWTGAVELVGLRVVFGDGHSHLKGRESS